MPGTDVSGDVALRRVSDIVDEGNHGVALKTG